MLNNSSDLDTWMLRPRLDAWQRPLLLQRPAPWKSPRSSKYGTSKKVNQQKGRYFGCERKIHENTNTTETVVSVAVLCPPKTKIVFLLKFLEKPWVASIKVAANALDSCCMHILTLLTVDIFNLHVGTGPQSLIKDVLQLVSFTPLPVDWPR